MSRRGVANRLCRHAIAPKSLRKPIPSYPVKAGLEGISGVAVRLLQPYLFTKRDLNELFKPPSIQPTVSPHLLLLRNL